jgi:DNA-binding transcriptional MerR regulator
MNQMEDIFLLTPSEVCEELKVKDSTLRKYVGILESAGYEFSRNNRGHRQYKQIDVIALRKFIAASERPDMTLETAASLLVSMLNQKSMTVTVAENEASQNQHNNGITVINEKFSSLESKVSDLENKVNNLVDVNMQLLQRLDERDHYIKESIEKRDKKLMESLRSIQEQRKEEIENMKLIAATNEEKMKKGFFARLLGK